MSLGHAGNQVTGEQITPPNDGMPTHEQPDESMQSGDDGAYVDSDDGHGSTTESFPPEDQSSVAMGSCNQVTHSNEKSLRKFSVKKEAHTSNNILFNIFCHISYLCSVRFKEIRKTLRFLIAFLLKNNLQI